MLKIRTWSNGSFGPSDGSERQSPVWRNKVALDSVEFLTIESSKRCVKLKASRAEGGFEAEITCVDPWLTDVSVRVEPAESSL